MWLAGVVVRPAPQRGRRVAQALMLASDIHLAVASLINFATAATVRSVHCALANLRSSIYLQSLDDRALDPLDQLLACHQA